MEHFYEIADSILFSMRRLSLVLICQTLMYLTTQKTWKKEMPTGRAFGADYKWVEMERWREYKNTVFQRTIPITLSCNRYSGTEENVFKAGVKKARLFFVLCCSPICNPEPLFIGFVIPKLRVGLLFLQIGKLLQNLKIFKSSDLIRDLHL